MRIPRSRSAGGRTVPPLHRDTAVSSTAGKVPVQPTDCSISRRRTLPQTPSAMRKSNRTRGRKPFRIVPPGAGSCPIIPLRKVTAPQHWATTGPAPGGPPSSPAPASPLAARHPDAGRPHRDRPPCRQLTGIRAYPEHIRGTHPEINSVARVHTCGNRRAQTRPEVPERLPDEPGMEDSTIRGTSARRTIPDYGCRTPANPGNDYIREPAGTAPRAKSAGAKRPRGSRGDTGRSAGPLRP